MEPIRRADPGDIGGDNGNIDGDSDVLGEPERLESAPPVAVPPAVRRVVIGAAVGVAALIMAVVLLGESIGRSAPAPGAVESPTPTPSSTPVSFPSPQQPTPTPARPAVFGSSGFLADLDLVVYVRSNRALFRIDTKARQVTRTPMGLDSDEPVSLMALNDRVLVRPWDERGGFVVVDGRPPRRLTGPLAGGGAYYPGPAGRVWTISSTVTDGKVTANLTDASGKRVFASIELATSGTIYGDGAGGLFYEEIGGTYQATSSGLRRVTGGRILATSRHVFLATECDDEFACGTYAYDRRTETRRRVGPAQAERSIPGVLSPNGRYVALQLWESTSGPSLGVIEASSGKQIGLFPMGEDSDGFHDASGVWLPDGRLLWLRESRLAVFDPRSKQLARSRLRLPPLIQLAVRQPAG